jgi:hypothetical protein
MKSIYPVPAPMCGCGPHHWALPPRQCWREAKELLLDPGEDQLPVRTVDEAVSQDKVAFGAENAQTLASSSEKVLGSKVQEILLSDLAKNGKRAIIGGCCCVSLSIEYMPTARAAVGNLPCRVAAWVVDSAGSNLIWEKSFAEGYHVKDGIITTYPGAILWLAGSNAIARVRWAETFSC